MSYEPRGRLRVRASPSRPARRSPQVPREGTWVFHVLKRLTLIPWTKARSRLANAVQAGETPAQVALLRRDYRVARTAQLVCELLSADPPPTPEQRRELASLLAGGGDRDVAA